MYTFLMGVCVPAGVSILAIPDTHFPFADQLTLAAVYDLAASLKPKIIIQLGDLHDLFSFGRFHRSHNLLTPKQELVQAYADASEFWEKLLKAAPRAKHIQIRGNHDERPFKRLIEKAPELETLYSDRYLWEFPGVETYYEAGEVLEIYGIYFTHGTYTTLGDHAKRFMRSVVHGHTHRGGVVHFQYIRDQSGRGVWELDAGCAGDPLQVSFAYAGKIKNWTSGCGLIDSLGPRFIELAGRRAMPSKPQSLRLV